MAGVEVVKTKVSSIAHQSAHYDEERRRKVNHKNPHIDKSKSHLNYNLGGAKWKDIMSKARDKVKEIDKEKPPKRVKTDRKTMMVFDIYCPNTVTDDKLFFERFYEKYEEAYPNSMMGMQVHVDEQHWYIDPHKKEQCFSMKHGHCFVIPNDKEKGINMKSFLTRDWYKKVNDICEEVAKEFGTTYHTGEGQHEDRTMEQMKIASAKAAERQAKENDEVIDFQMQAITNMDKEVEILQSDLLKVEKELSTAKEELTDCKEQVKGFKALIRSFVDKFHELKPKALKKAFNDIFKQRKSEASIHTCEKYEPTIQEWLDNNDLQSQIPIDECGKYVNGVNKLEELVEEIEI